MSLIAYAFHTPLKNASHNWLYTVLLNEATQTTLSISNNTLQSKTGLSESTIQRGLSALKKRGLVMVSYHRGDIAQHGGRETLITFTKVREMQGVANYANHNPVHTNQYTSDLQRLINLIGRSAYLLRGGQIERLLKHPLITGLTSGKHPMSKELPKEFFAFIGTLEDFKGSQRLSLTEVKFSFNLCKQEAVKLNALLEITPFSNSAVFSKRSSVKQASSSVYKKSSSKVVVRAREKISQAAMCESATTVGLSPDATTAFKMREGWEMSVPITNWGTWGRAEKEKGLGAGVAGGSMQGATTESPTTEAKGARNNSVFRRERPLGAVATSGTFEVDLKSNKANNASEQRQDIATLTGMAGAIGKAVMNATGHARKQYATSAMIEKVGERVATFDKHGSFPSLLEIHARWGKRVEQYVMENAVGICSRNHKQITFKNVLDELCFEVRKGTLAAFLGAKLPSTPNDTRNASVGLQSDIEAASSGIVVSPECPLDADTVKMLREWDAGTFGVDDFWEWSFLNNPSSAPNRTSDAAVNERRVTAWVSGKKFYLAKWEREIQYISDMQISS